MARCKAATYQIKDKAPHQIPGYPLDSPSKTQPSKSSKITKARSTPSRRSSRLQASTYSKKDQEATSSAHPITIEEEDMNPPPEKLDEIKKTKTVKEDKKEKKKRKEPKPDKVDDLIAAKGILPGRIFLLHYLKTEGWNLLGYANAQGWADLLQLSTPYYPSLVRIFYSNIRVYPEGKISSYVRGKRISLTIESLGEALNIPIQGNQVYDNSWMEECNFPEKEVNSTLLKDPDADITPSNLKALPKVFSTMAMNHLAPRAGGAHKIQATDAIIAYHMTKCIPLCLPYIIIRHLSHIVKQAKMNTTLPYGMILTLVFQHFKIPLEDEEKVSSFSTFDKKTMNQLKVPPFSNDPPSLSKITSMAASPKKPVSAKPKSQKKLDLGVEGSSNVSMKLILTDCVQESIAPLAMIPSKEGSPLPDAELTKDPTQVSPKSSKLNSPHFGSITVPALGAPEEVSPAPFIIKSKKRKASPSIDAEEAQRREEVLRARKEKAPIVTHPASPPTSPIRSNKGIVIREPSSDSKFEGEFERIDHEETLDLMRTLQEVRMLNINSPPQHIQSPILTLSSNFNTENILSFLYSPLRGLTSPSIFSVEPLVEDMVAPSTTAVDGPSHKVTAQQFKEAVHDSKLSSVEEEEPSQIPTADLPPPVAQGKTEPNVPAECITVPKALAIEKQLKKTARRVRQIMEAQHMLQIEYRHHAARMDMYQTLLYQHVLPKLDPSLILPTVAPPPQFPDIPRPSPSTSSDDSSPSK